MKTESHTVSKAPSQGKGEELKKDFLLALFEPQLYFVRTLLFYSLFGCVGWTQQCLCIISNSNMHITKL